MNNDGPPLIFSFLGVIVGVGVAWLITRESTMALVFLAIGLIGVSLLHLQRRRRR